MIKIISDSTCDLSQEVLERYDIDIIPLHIVKGDEELEDGPQIDIHALYEWADKNKTTPKTSAPSIETAINVMRPYIDEGREIICFSISSEMSTSINVIRMAAEELDAEDKVTVIDSRNLSTGIGLLVVEAAVMAADGKSREEIKTGIDELIPKVRASFVVDTLVYLYRGGRCNAVSALIGGALALHQSVIFCGQFIHAILFCSLLLRLLSFDFSLRIFLAQAGQYLDAPEPGTYSTPHTVQFLAGIAAHRFVGMICNSSTKPMNL